MDAGKAITLKEARARFEELRLGTLLILSLIICFGPFCWVLVVSENRWLWIKLWPLLPGLFTAVSIRNWLSRYRVELPTWELLSLSLLITLILLALTLLLLQRVRRRRPAVMAWALVIFSLLSWITYWLYRA